MVLLGVQAVRDLVSGIVLFDHCQRHSPGLKHLMLLSMLSANHAREVALKLRSVRPEEAYFWGMFRNIGEVLTASCLEEEYAAILRDMTESKRSQREACLRVLGFEYRDLGQAMARRWAMPAQLDRAIRATESSRDLVGCLSFDRVASGAAPDEATLTLLRRLRDAAARAMAERRS
jgi:HD-like signal output (HDOD) protein